MHLLGSGPRAASAAPDPAASRGLIRPAGRCSVPRAPGLRSASCLPSHRHPEVS